MTLAHTPIGDAGLALAAILGAVALYGRGAGRRPVAGPRVAAFGVGALALIVAVASPLERAAQDRFALHMVQHLLLIVVAAPAFALAATPRVVAAGLPAGLRRSVHTSLPAAAWRRVRRRHPSFVVLVAGAGYVVVVSTWHLPALYDVAVERELVHVGEHATMLASATLFWTLARELGPRVPGAAFFATFAASVVSGVLGALITFAPAPLYDAHRAPDPLADQQLAGVLMWVPGGLAYLALAVWLVVGFVVPTRARRRTEVTLVEERPVTTGAS